MGFRIFAIGLLTTEITGPNITDMHTEPIMEPWIPSPPRLAAKRPIPMAEKSKRMRMIKNGTFEIAPLIIVGRAS